jgi:leucyl aminopeptidase
MNITNNLQNLLPVAEIEALTALQAEVIDTLEKRQLWRTETEMRISVLNDLHFPTKASKYWQSVREQAVFIEQLAQLGRDYRRNEIHIKQTELEIAEEKDTLEIELLKIDLEEKLYKARTMELEAKDRMREIKLWSNIKQELDDGSFDTQDANTHQLVSYGQKWARQMASANPNQMSTSEYHNLAGQFYTAAEAAHKAGVLDQMLEGLPPEVVVKMLPGLELKPND